MASSSTTCPYCLEEIASQAHVCRHCRREVRLLLDARAEVEVLKARLAALAPAAAADLPTAPRKAGLALAGGGTVAVETPAKGQEWWLSLGVLLLFYLVPTPVMVLSTSPAREYLPLVLAVLTGGVLAYYCRSNLWMLGVYGFAQPLVATLVLVAWPGSASIAFNLPLRDSAVLGLAAAVAGAVALLLFGRERVKDALALEVPSRWLKRGEAGVRTALNLATALAGLVTLLVGLLK